MTSPPTEYWLPKALTSAIVQKEILCIGQCPLEVVQAWSNHPTRWVNAGMCPPENKGPYLISYWPTGLSRPDTAEVGFSMFNRGWSTRCSFEQIKEAASVHSTGKELPLVPYNLSYLFWKGLAPNSLKLS